MQYILFIILFHIFKISQSISYIIPIKQTLDFMQVFFYMYKYTMFLEQEKPEMDDFKEKKMVLKGTLFEKF